MPENKWSDPPKGWWKYKRKIIPSYAPIKVPQPTTIPYTPDFGKLIDKAQFAITRAPYKKGFSADYTPNAAGDCIGKSRYAQEFLRSQGIDEGALRLRAVMTETKEPHMVLDVFTDQGIFTVDGRALNVTKYGDLPYSDLAREHPGSALWENLQNSPGEE